MSRTGRMVALVLVSLFVFGTAAVAQEAELEKLPPSVIKTVPQSGATNVDPNLKEISVTFSKDMMDQAWSFVQASKETFPTLVGSPKYLDDKRTCVVGVELKPNQAYVIWLNSAKFRNFKDAGGQPAVPYLLEFKTGGGGQAE